MEKRLVLTRAIVRELCIVFFFVQRLLFTYRWFLHRVKLIKEEIVRPSCSLQQRGPSGTLIYIGRSIALAHDLYLNGRYLKIETNKSEAVSLEKRDVAGTRSRRGGEQGRT